jgi:hypothetical protein
MKHISIGTKLTHGTRIRRQSICHAHNLMSLGPNYAITRNPRSYISDLIVETESAIRKLDVRTQNPFRYIAARKLDVRTQNPFRYIAARKIKQIAETQTKYHLHRSILRTVNEIKDILSRDRLVVKRADKAKAIVILEQESLDQK